MSIKGHSNGKIILFCSLKMIQFISSMYSESGPACTRMKHKTLKHYACTHGYKQRSTCLHVHLQQNGQSCNHNAPSVSTGGRQRAHLLATIHPMNFAAESPSPFKSNNKQKKLLTACKSQQEDQDKSNTGVIRYLNQTDQIYHITSAIYKINWNMQPFRPQYLTSDHLNKHKI